MASAKSLQLPRNVLCSCNEVDSICEQGDWTCAKPGSWLQNLP